MVRSNATSEQVVNELARKPGSLLLLSLNDRHESKWDVSAYDFLFREVALMTFISTRLTGHRFQVVPLMNNDPVHLS